MKQVSKPILKVSQVVGKQTVMKDTQYRWCYFSIKESVDDGILIYSNLLKEMLLLSKEEVSQIESILPNYQTNELFEYLVENWFIVPVDFNEIALCDQVRQVLRVYETTQNAITEYTILPTTGCNARCFYCYEAGIKPMTMDEKTAIATAEYIIRNSKNQPVRIGWFGGEPLCNVEAIRKICNYLKGHGVEYSSSMVSNSSMFTKELVEEAVSLWKLDGIQITVDGLEDTYNKAKNYYNKDEFNFKRLMDNMQLICDADIRVQVRLNVDLYNIEEMFELVDFLNNRFGKYKKFFLYAVPIYENVGFQVTNRSNEQRNELFQKIQDLSNHMKKIGVNTREMFFDQIKIRSCSADTKNATIIVPDGHLAFCEHYLTDDFWGTVYEDKPKPDWTPYSSLIPECFSCPSYPTCLFLSKCPTSISGCHDYNRFDRLQAVRRGMIRHYNKYRSKGEADGCKDC